MLDPYATRRWLLTSESAAWLLQLLPYDPRRPTTPGNPRVDAAVATLDRCAASATPAHMATLHVRVETRGLLFLAGLAFARGLELRTLTRAESARVARVLSLTPDLSSFRLARGGELWRGTAPVAVDVGQLVHPQALAAELALAEREVQTAASVEDAGDAAARRRGLLALILGTWEAASPSDLAHAREAEADAGHALALVRAGREISGDGDGETTFHPAEPITLPTCTPAEAARRMGVGEDTLRRLRYRAP